MFNITKATSNGGKALKELTEIMKNIGYKSFEAENSKNNSRGASGKIKDVLKAGGKLGFNVVLESLKAGGVENYVKQQAIEESKKVGSYVAHCVADRIRERLGGKHLQANDNGVSAKTFKSCVVSASHSKTKAPEVLR